MSNRDRALELVEEGVVSAEDMITMCLKYMSEDDVADMLDANELSDRFLDHDEKEFDDYEDDGQPDSYTEYQDLYGGDDAFETCSYMEDF